MGRNELVFLIVYEPVFYVPGREPLGETMGLKAESSGQGTQHNKIRCVFRFVWSLIYFCRMWCALL